jgi:hypothetical protein
MKDDEYFGFSTNDDFKVVNLPDDAHEDEDDFKLVDLVNFATEGDIRIVSLDDVDAYRNSASEQHTGHNWIGHMDHMTRRTSPLSSASALKLRCTRKRQIVKSAIVALVVVMVLLVFTGKSFIGARVGVQTSTASASQSVPVAPNRVPSAQAAPFIIDANHYYIQLDLNWAQILLDGHSLKYVPIPGVDPPLQISVGHHLVMWRMNTSQTYSCTMSVPPSLMDTCVYDGPEPFQDGVSVWIITMPHFDDGT